MMRAITFLVLVAILTLVGSSTAAPTPSAYFPLTPGTVWTYRTNTQGDIMVRVGGVRKIGAADCRLIETFVHGEISQQECYSVRQDGVYVLQRSFPAGAVVLDPPQRLLAAPVSIGQQWEWRGKIDKHEVVFFYTWARRESVKTAAGTFTAVQLYFEGAPGMNVRVQSWRSFAPSVGMVKEDTVLSQGSQTTRVYAELLKVTMGK